MIKFIESKCVLDDLVWFHKVSRALHRLWQPDVVLTMTHLVGTIRFITVWLICVVTLTACDIGDSSIGDQRPEPEQSNEQFLPTPELVEVDNTKAPNGIIESCYEGNGFHRVDVLNVLSSTQIKVKCETRTLLVTYVALLPLSGDEMLLERALSLNKFLVANKTVLMRKYDSYYSQGEFQVLAEVFADGESVNVRLISNGLVELGDRPDGFDNMEVFHKALKEAEIRMKGVWKGREKQMEVIDKSESVTNNTPPVGCGTLPCRP